MQIGIRDRSIPNKNYLEKKKKKTKMEKKKRK
jgi:hypothetical protein